MKLCFFILHPSSFILFCILPAFAQQPYDRGDWTSYRDFRYARAIDAGAHEVFVATTGGILEYHLTKDMWYDPIVVGYAISAPVEIDDPTLLLLDEETQYVWVATKTQFLIYDLGADLWRVEGRRHWMESDRVVNIGVGGNEIYVETMPEHLYPRLFHAQNPLPDPIWRGMVTRYKGSRQFGGLMIDIDPAEPTNVRWRGLRSKIPLEQDDLTNPQPLPPAGFPAPLMPPGYSWLAEGTILDPALRSAPITDWVVDRWGTIWTTHWGLGVLQNDTRLGQVQFYSAGPAGNDIRAISVEAKGFWMGGLNTRDREGFASADGYLIDWSLVEQRDDREIRSTDLWDIALWQSARWFATNDGLLSFNEQKRWQRFDVSDNLYSDEIRAVLPTDTALWIGTSRGLVYMGRQKEIWRIQNSGIELAGVTDLARIGDSIFVATPQGLFKGSLATRQFTFTDLDPGLLNAPVLDMSTHGTELWLATADGIELYDLAAGASKSYLASDRMNGSNPSCICATEKYVWIGTDHDGFYRLRKETGEWIRYDNKDGLVDNRVQVIRQDGDDLLIGTANGLTRFFWNRPNRAR